MSTQYRDNAILAVLAMIDPYHPGFTGTAEIAAKLKDDELHGYIWAWVLPALHTAMGDLTHKWNRDGMNMRAVSIRAAIRREQRIAELQSARDAYIGAAGRHAVAAASTWDRTEEAKELAALLAERKQLNPNFTPPKRKS